jgi:hypothetical protein
VEERIAINEVLNARRLSEGKNINITGFVLIENLFNYFFSAKIYDLIFRWSPNKNESFQV